MSLRADARLGLGLVSAALDRDRPMIANLIITRRCNLSCGYCFEYDKVSPPVPVDVLKERIDHLARLRAVIVTLTGGESLLHPDAAELVRYIRARGMTPMLNTNGYLLTRTWIDALNDARLYGMQLSIDNAKPNEISKKSLKPLLPKLRLLAEHARFRVRINTVLGGGPPEEAVEVARAVRELGFDSSTALMRHADGSIIPLDERARLAYAEIRALGKRAIIDDQFQHALAEGTETPWKCRAGARTFHVCEDGLVHLCAPRTSRDSKPIAAYTVDDIREAFDRPKACTARCPIAYAHHASRFDQRRGQRGEPEKQRRHLPLAS
jgi:MoaA/NifB/PqqE/SkfB family radical SAM enzyme